MKTPIYTGTWGNCHIQGIAVDRKNGHIYYSFTTKLVKATLEGKIIGSVEGLVGHLGCIAFNEDDGCVYGSLEYKNDIIGRGILDAIGASSQFSDGFYAARFDVAKIDAVGMRAENSDIMSAVYLKEVTDDYNGRGFDKNGNVVAHKYGCSGIDGMTFGPLPGETESDKRYLYVAYGVYDDVTRNDNDHQVLLCYDISAWDGYGKKLDQNDMHRSGPVAPDRKFFVYTGNTRYGVQNLEYDPFTNAFFMAVYRGQKPEFPNYALFAVDAVCPGVKKFVPELRETVETLRLKNLGLHDGKSGVYGWDFPYGSTGLYSFGDGTWLICQEKSTPEGQCGYIYSYRWNGEEPFAQI